MYGLQYSADGRRIIAGDYPGGIVQLWDAKTGKQLTKIETGYAFRSSSDYFSLTPDWQHVFVSSTQRNMTRFERDGKKMMRWEFGGRVRAWDLESGKVVAQLQHSPPSNPLSTALSPDGKWILTGDQLPGEYEGRATNAATLWNVATNKPRQLGENLGPFGVFSADSRVVAVCAMGDRGYATAIKLFDVASGKPKRELPIDEEFTSSTILRFDPTGRKLIARVQAYRGLNDYSESRSYLRIWDVESGRVLASLATDEKEESFGWPGIVSPDGRTLALGSWGSKDSKLFLIDLIENKQRSTIPLAKNVVVHDPAFSPDGKWIAISTQEFPKEFQRDPAAEDVAQPRIHLIEVAANAVRETMIAPQGFSTSCCFSPDGKTLATGGRGKVLLWDMTKPFREEN